MIDKINKKQYELKVDDNCAKIYIKYPFDDVECSVEVKLNKENEEDLKKTIINLRDIIKKQHQEINELKELKQIFIEKDEYYKKKFLEIDSKFDRLPEIM